MIEKQGDLLESSEDVIAHGCNTQGSMGAGIAKQIKERHPAVHRKYIEICDIYDDESLLSELQFVKVNKGDYDFVANVFTQQYYGRRHSGLDYTVFAHAMDKLIRICSEEDLSLAMPRIGCGLAGGDWDMCKDIIDNKQDRYNHYELIVYYL